MHWTYLEATFSLTSVVILSLAWTSIVIREHNTIRPNFDKFPLTMAASRFSSVKFVFSNWAINANLLPGASKILWTLLHHMTWDTVNII